MISLLDGPLDPLTRYCQFILYRLKLDDNGRVNKQPLNPHTLNVSNALDPANWVDYLTAAKLADLQGDEIGVGFVLTVGDPFFFVDIDHCLQEDKKWSPVAIDLCNQFSGAAVEISQSGEGLHIIGFYRDAAPEHACKNTTLGLEMYTQERFIALTGCQAQGNALMDFTDKLPSVINAYFRIAEQSIDSPLLRDWRSRAADEWSGTEDDELLLQIILNSKGSAAAIFGGKAPFKDLWENNIKALHNFYTTKNKKARLAQNHVRKKNVSYCLLRLWQRLRGTFHLQKQCITTT